MKEKVKGWITWPDVFDFGWCHCQLILENGWPLYGHLCSAPNFALGDLWNCRKERQKEWEEKGLELEIVASVPHSKLPSYILENNKNEVYVEWAEKHFGPLEKRDETPKVEVVLSDDTVLNKVPEGL